MSIANIPPSWFLLTKVPGHSIMWATVSLKNPDLTAKKQSAKNFPETEFFIFYIIIH